MTPEERLCSRTWRLTNSGWMLTSLLGLGLTTWAGFLYIGIKARRAAWLVAATAWAAYAAVIIVLTSVLPSGTKEDPAPGSAWIGLVLIVGLAGGVVHQAISNRAWLRWRSKNPRGSSVWYASPGSTTPAGRPSDAARADAVLRGAMAGSSSTVPPAHRSSGSLAQPGSSASPGPAPAAAPLDLNAASVGDLAGAGLGPEFAAAVVAARQRLGAFTSREQMLTDANIPPHVYLPLRDQFWVAPRPAPEGAPRGRRLDL